MELPKTVLTKYILTLCLLAIFLAVNVDGEIIVSASKLDDRITNGENATIEEFPQMVQLSLKDVRSPFCGGFLISRRHVVTAAHCFKDRLIFYKKKQLTHFITNNNVTFYNLKKFVVDYQVFANATYSKTGGISRKVEAIYIPRSYNQTSRNFDVAVVRLRAAFPLGVGIKVAELCETSWDKQQSLRIAGWGYQQPNDNKAERLMTTRLRTIADNRCKDRLRSIKIEVKKKIYKSFDFSDTMSCAMPDEGKDACGGDSGGPAYINNKVCGIVSFGISCGFEKVPSFFTSIAKSRKFIDAAMEE